MARKKTSVLEDLMEISSRLPWQAGVGLAIVAYLVLHYFATTAPLTTNPAELKAMGKSLGDSMVSGMWHSIAGVLQYIVPLAFLVGAGVSAMRRGDKQVEETGGIPSCPKCGSAMVRRTAKTGSNAGNTFWGCSQFPACRGIRS